MLNTYHVVGVTNDNTVIAWGKVTQGMRLPEHLRMPCYEKKITPLVADFLNEFDFLKHFDCLKHFDVLKHFDFLLKVRLS